MKCQVCGAGFQKITTDLPFKLRQGNIVILKQLPVFQCNNCSEYSLEDPVMAQVEQILDKIDKTAELEVLHYGTASL